MKKHSPVFLLLLFVIIGCKLPGSLTGGSKGATATGGSDPRADVVAASKKFLELPYFTANMEGTGQTAIKSQVAYAAPDRYHVTFSADSRVAAFSVSDHETRLIVVETGEEFATLPTGRMLNSLAFSPAGDRLVAACEPGYFQLWDLRHLREQLAGMKLDWPGPPLPSGSTTTKPVRVTVISKASPPPGSAAGKAGGP